jgi:hypothetical protein
MLIGCAVFPTAPSSTGASKLAEPKVSGMERSFDSDEEDGGAEASTANKAFHGLRLRSYMDAKRGAVCVVSARWRS